jgi:hypothetical protein
MPNVDNTHAHAHSPSQRPAGRAKREGDNRSPDWPGAALSPSISAAISSSAECRGRNESRSGAARAPVWSITVLIDFWRHSKRRLVLARPRSLSFERASFLSRERHRPPAGEQLSAGSHARGKALILTKTNGHLGAPAGRASERERDDRRAGPLGKIGRPGASACDSIETRAGWRAVIMIII